MYISENVAAKRCPLIEPTSGEYICIEVDIKCTPHLLCFFYRPPSLNINDFIDNIFHILTKAKFYSIHNIYLIGDSNTKHQEWCTYDATSSDGKALKNFFDCNDFSQLIDEPTRFANTSHSCIDHIFTNSTFNVNEFGTLPKYSCFDHCPIYFRLYPQTSSIHTAYKRTVWNYKNANFLMFRISLMNVAWNTIFTTGDTNEITNNFMNLLTYNAK